MSAIRSTRRDAEMEFFLFARKRCNLGCIELPKSFGGEIDVAVDLRSGRDFPTYSELMNYWLQLDYCRICFFFVVQPSQARIFAGFDCREWVVIKRSSFP